MEVSEVSLPLELTLARLKGLVLTCGYAEGFVFCAKDGL